MVAQFTDRHLGKRVVDHNGVEVGTVDDVRNGDLYVKVGPDADSETLSELHWDGTVNKEVHRLPDQYVSDITDTTVRITI
ncbi:hypothetical protein [Halodesulfurarchaeum formicicum]|uniref:PRC-barrel domain-containing protein n=1 Tax=Halodesulfurarchaeum formicicum TaxID=1873524 RepID=A0A1J1AAW3_9EURY|nr:hypothetical protein [Halodesulfurarchaeum formicicum]APE94871.1 hypothetical protein HSR6_0405 [Halodesulfurarchaeum formicicum]